MRGMFDFIEKDGIITPKFKEIKPCELTDDTIFCTLQDLIDLLGEERGIDLYATIKAFATRRIHG